MSKIKNLSNWDLIVESVEGEIHEGRVRQQNLFRLFQAVRESKPELVEEYIDAGVSLDAPLIFAESNGGAPRSEQFKFAEISDLTSCTILGWVAGRGDLVWTKKLIEEYDVDYNIQFSGGRDACWVAMEMRQDECFSYFLNLGVSPNFKRSDSLFTSRLIQATKNSDYNSVKTLIQKKAKPNTYDAIGRTALHYNFEKDPYTDDDEMIANLLIDWGGIPTAQDVNGVTPADLAHTDFHDKLLVQHNLEKRIVVAPPTPAVEAPSNDEIIRLEPGDPGMPQLQKPPVFKSPRF